MGNDGVLWILSGSALDFCQMEDTMKIPNTVFYVLPKSMKV